ncbi:MAG: hypothetical protein ABSB70_21840 [Candidatus Velthaea sp.]|jgi:hypothetical protein
MAAVQSVALPPKSDPRWTALVTGKSSKPLKLLALKLMLTRMSMDCKKDPSPSAVTKNVGELYDYFTKNFGKNAQIIEDTATLFG